MSGESGAGLRRDAIGLREVLSQSITAMAPAAAVAASIASGAAFAGGSLPLAVLIALVACPFTASRMAELARELPAAGSVSTYAAQGLHPVVGFLVGWGYVFVEALVPPLPLLQLGFTTAGTLHQEWSSYPADLWWPWALAGGAVITAAGFAVLHPRYRSPVAGIAVQSAVAVGAVLGLGLGYDPVTAFLLLTTLIVTVVIGVYIVVNLACAGYFLRRGRESLKPVRHLLLPALGIAAFVPALLTAAGLPVFDFVTQLTAPVSYGGPIVGIWMAAGIVVLVVLMRRHPGRIAETARVYLDEPAPTHPADPADPAQNGATHR
ncbi:hypothetical protein [Streptomyces sp. MAI_2237]